MLALEILILTSFIVALAFAIKGSMGFAEGVVMVSLMALFMDVRAILPVTVIVSILADALLLLYIRSHFDVQLLRFVIVGIIAGVLVGYLILNVLESDLIKKLFAAFLIIYAIKIISEKSSALRRVNELLGIPAGFCAGFMDVLFGSPGPPLAVYFHHQIHSKQVFRATIIAALVVSHILRFGTYAYSGLLTQESLVFPLYLIPAMLLGLFVGSRIHMKFDEVVFKKAIGVMLLIIGIVLML